MNQQSLLFLIINASIVWAVVAGGLMWFLRSKLLLLAIFLAPFVIGSTFQHVTGMPKLIGFYGTSMLYGAFGIVFGVLYADYERTKRFFQRASKTSFLARGGIALSSLYLITYFGQKIIFENPLVEFALGYIDGGNKAKEMMSQVDYDGATTAGICIFGSFGVLAINKYRDYKSRELEHRKLGEQKDL